ncbi:CBS domain-containing protein [Mycolicibacterium pulveris]|nr:CBS domain-containing protein [Mycolicibacterium pulveris]
MVLKPSDSVLEAARAIEHNRIGAVAVQQDGRLVGIATDRDLTVRALGQGLDAASTKISEVMTPNPLTLSPRDDTADALRLMTERNVRRIPLVEGERIVGMVTLDDLILDEAAPLEELAEVVEAQIGEGGPADSERAPGRRRSLVRAETTLNRLVNLVHEEAGLDDRDQARAALDVVVSSLVRRLNAGEAKDFVSQLPSLLKPHVRSLPPGPDRSVTQESIEAELVARAGIDEAKATSVFVAVANTVLDSISPGQAEQVRSQLPKELQKLFEPGV